MAGVTSSQPAAGFFGQSSKSITISEDRDIYSPVYADLRFSANPRPPHNGPSKLMNGRPSFSLIYNKFSYTLTVLHPEEMFAFIKI